MKVLAIFLTIFFGAAFAFSPFLAAQPCLVTDFDQVLNATQNCTDIIIDGIVVPGGETLLLDLLNGTKVTFKGVTTFEYFGWKGPLVRINGNAITVQGEKGSVLYGKGELYWDGKGQWGAGKPTFFIIQATGGSVFQHLNIYNAPIASVHINNSHDVVFTNWFINNAAGAPGVALSGKEGHNTDGFGVNRSTNVIIKDSVLYNQDDCVALNSGANIFVTNLVCYGSHGLSLSVGFSNDSYIQNSLYNVTIQDSIIMDAMDGIHIKTHIDAGEGIIQNVTYKNIFMAGSYKYGIAIEQNYTNAASHDSAALPLNNIPINGLRFINVSGTVNNNSVPIYIVCAENGCLDWEVDHVYISGHLDSQCVNFKPDGIDCIESKV